MRRIVVLVLSVILSVPVFCQTSADKYVAGSIVEVKRHKENKTTNSDAPIHYDITLKVGGTLYTVLYTPPKGSTIVEYRVGADLPVLVGDKTISFPDIAGVTHEVPILRKRPATAKD